jgi:NAD(P)-dependent dehydrogenase (short-subunit alcohol dehydrogenase family)
MLSYNLQGKVAIVTGASRGIGAAIALRLAREGADVVVNYVNDEKSAQAVAEQITALGRQALVIQADVSQREPVQRMVRQVLDTWRHIDILVSNAGAGAGGPVGDTTDEDWERVFGVNVKGLFNLAREIMPLMKAQRSGKIVAISSIVGKTGRSMLSVGPATYAGAKAAIVGYVRAMAREGAPYGVNVNAIRPGWIDTEMHLRNIPDDARLRAVQEMPLGRTGRPEDIAGAVAFLVSEDSSYITGHALDVNGGLFIG